MEQKKKKSVYIFFIVLLSLLLAGSIILGLSGVYCKDIDDSPTSLKIGQSAVITLNGTGSQVMSYNFDGAFLAGEFLKQNISVKNSSEKDLFLRARLNIFTGDGDDPVLTMQTSEIWSKQDDGYYLFEEYVSSLNTVSLSSGFVISPEKQMKSDNAYILVITVEGLSTEFDRMSVWGY